MMPYQTVCVAVALQRYIDFPPVALRQRELAIAVGRQFKASLFVLSVDAPVALMGEVESTAEKLARFAKGFSDAGLEVATSHRRGKPSAEIRDYVKEVVADLLIIGSHSKRGPLDVGLGSTASALRHEMDLAVVLVRPTEAEAKATRELMIPDFPFLLPYG